MKRIVLLTLAALLVASPAAADQHDRACKRCPVVKPAKAERPRMDVVFTIDATSSMADEIDVIKTEVWNIANKIVSGKPSPDVRFGLVLYRDTTDARLVEVTALTRDIDSIYEKLMAAEAIGGGDKPEHVGKGLHASLDLDWDLDPKVKKSIYLVGDAGANPHPEFTVASALDRAAQMNVAINTIGCSGLSSGEKAEFTAMATRTGGAFEALTYYAVVDNDDGTKSSVVYYDGETYETKGEISADEWKKGGKKVIAQKKMKRASASTRSKASAAPKANNLDAVVRDDVMEEAASMGVDY